MGATLHCWLEVFFWSPNYVPMSIASSVFGKFTPPETTVLSDVLVPPLGANLRRKQTSKTGGGFWYSSTAAYAAIQFFLNHSKREIISDDFFDLRSLPCTIATEFKFDAQAVVVFIFTWYVIQRYSWVFIANHARGPFFNLSRQFFLAALSPIRRRFFFTGFFVETFRKGSVLVVHHQNQSTYF